MLASLVYRARDTAALAFGRADIEVTTDLVADDYAGGALRDVITATERLLTSEPPEGPFSSADSPWRINAAGGGYFINVDTHPAQR